MLAELIALSESSEEDADQGDIQQQRECIECAFCRLFVQELHVAIWAKICPICNGTGVVSLESYVLMIDAYLNEAALKGLPATDKPAQSPPLTRCTNPQCKAGTINADTPDEHYCPDCRGTGHLGGWPTAEWVRNETVPCVYCTNDVDGIGGTVQERMEHCKICRGVGVKSKRFYQRLLLMLQTAPTREHKPYVPEIHGTMTLSEALSRATFVVTKLKDRPMRLWVAREYGDHDRFQIRLQHTSQSLDDQPTAIERKLPFPAVEDYLRRKIGYDHIDEHGWTPYEFVADFAGSERRPNGEEEGTR